jgi:hypothetical protein
MSTTIDRQPENSDALNEFLVPYQPRVQELVLALRALTLRVLPSVLEQVDPPSKIIAYGYDLTCAGLICAIAPYKAHVNLMLARGAELPDPEQLLEGTGKRARHVRITAPAEVESPALRTLLEAAAAEVPQRLPGYTLVIHGRHCSLHASLGARNYEWYNHCDTTIALGYWPSQPSTSARTWLRLG